MNCLSLQFLQSEVGRISEMIQFADKKASFLSVYYTAIIGFLFTQKLYVFEGFSRYQDLETIYLIFCLSFLIPFLIGLYHLFLSILPRLDNKNIDKSLLYFGHIASRSLSKYTEELSVIEEKGLKLQLIEQIHTNSIIADKKMQHVRKSTMVLFAVAPILIMFIFFL